MADDFGLTANGLQVMRQADWVAYMQAQFQQAFGQNVNLDARGPSGQLIGIMSQPLALLSELLEAINASQSPSGAEGVAVDNILALSGLTRLPASYGTTNNVAVVQSNGVTLFGLVLTGTPGTTVPKGSLVADSQTPPNVFALDRDVTIAPAVNAQQMLVLSTQPTQGSYRLSIAAPSGATLTTPPIAYSAMAQQTQLSWPQAPTSGTYTLTVGVVPTGAIAYNAGSDAVAAAIKAATQIAVTVTGSVGAGMLISWPAGIVYLIAPSGDAAAPTVINPVQAAFDTLYDAASGTSPYTDVAVTSTTSTALTFTFGANAPVQGQPSSGGKAQPLILVAASALQAGSQVVNLSVSNTVQGAPAQGVGAATATTTGPQEVPAGTLKVIQTPVAGWSSVNNPLDCISGSDQEADTAAELRRTNLLANQANGPLAAILQRVRQVAGVTQAIAFQNLTNASVQTVTFSGTPSSGTWQLFTGTATTAPLPYNATPAQVQAALQALAGFDAVQVTGNVTYGYSVDFNGAQGGQYVPLLVVAGNSTGVPIAASFGRYPKSIEVVVQGGSNGDVAKAIYQAAPTGIATYSAPVLVTVGTVTAGSPTMVVQSTSGLTVGLTVNAFGVSPGTQVQSIQGANVVLSQAALGSYTNVRATFSNATPVTDSNGNLVIVGFSRPQPIPIYVGISLVTDFFKTPGVPSSGVNLAAKWTPASVQAIQEAVVDLGNAVPIGGLIVAQGSSGLVGAFNNVPGIVSYSLTIGTAQGQGTSSNLQLLPEQVGYFASFFVNVGYV